MYALLFSKILEAKGETIFKFRVEVSYTSPHKMIKRLVNQLQDFFGISRKEARAALVLMIFSFCLLWTPFIFRRWILPLVPLPSTPVNTQRLDSIALDLDKAAEIAETEDTYKKPSYKKTPSRPLRLFRFDPNQATAEELEELGIPKFLTKRIEKYRSKGGQFRKKEDLMHIYDFPSDVYKRLEPYIMLQNSPAKPAEYKNYESSRAEKPTVPVYNKEAKSNAKPVVSAFDINTADTTQLIRLKGIGTKLSLRIIKFRDALGGFHSASQFQEIFGLDSLAQSELNKYAKVQSPIRKININTATIEQLSSHSYLRNKKITSVIINYRDQHGPYAGIEDLKKVKVLDDVMIAKIAPYLTF